MGVHGLWRLLDATGKPVALETLEGKVLAVDVSIWLHQVMQGYQDGRGNPLPNAHLLGLFNRICKLLYYRIKPVFVFDGGVPLLKKNTIASRRKQKSVASSKAQKMKTDLINNLLKRTVVKGALGVENNEKQEEIDESAQISRSSVHSSLNLFKLPVLPSGSELLSEEEDDPSSEIQSSVELSPRKQARWKGNIHHVDVSSAEFKALPPDVRHDILTDLKASRKENSWGRLHEMPEESHDFSNYQMKRLLKRRNVQECLEEAEREMGGKTLTLDELDALLTEQGIATTTKDDKTSRIATDNITRFIYIDGIQKNVPTIKESNNTAIIGSVTNTEEMANTSDEDNDVKIIENLKEYELDDDWESDWESSEDQEVALINSKKLRSLVQSSDVNPAMMYMLEHSGLTQEQILSIIEQSKNKPGKSSEKNQTKSLKKRSKQLDVIIKSEPESDNENSSQVSITNVNSRSNSPFNISVKSNSSARGLIAVENNESSPQNSLSSQDSVCADLVNEIKSENVVKNNDSKVEDLGVISDSESDDFVEVEDVPIPSVDPLSKKGIKPLFEIAVKPELPLEEDMFADVFGTNESPIETESSVANNEVDKEIDLSEKHQPVYIELEDSPERPLVDEKIPCEMSVKSPIQDSIAETEIVSEDQVAASNSIQANEKVADIEPITVENEKNDKEEPAANDVEKTIEKNPFVLPGRKDELLDMQVQLEAEQKELTGNLGKLERQATDITDQMRIEAQELLRFFGIPYIVAPMEAEAQCAYLERINLTDGTITDDSDIWLFGGQCVYKNFFNLNKHVLQFRSCDIRHHFKLTREQMVQLALLVGSDYTIGVSGIGPVTALEILGAFPADEGNLLKGLINFRYWMNSGRSAGPGKTALRTKLRNIRVEEGFPSEAVVQAYLAPTVDESKEAFTWSKPNVTLLCDFTREKFGWNKHKFELIFNPITKRLTEPQKQKGIDSYFQVKISQKSIEGTLSKRVQKAVERLGNDRIEDDATEVEAPAKRQRKSRAKSEASGVLLEPITEVNKEASAEEAHTSSKDPYTSKCKETVVQSEYIPQRERDKANALKNKLRAIEVFRKSKRGPGYAKKLKRSIRKIKEDAELSESSDSS